MLSLTTVLCILPLLIYFLFFLCITSHDDIQMEYLCQAGPITGAPINSPHLPWLVYAYNPDDFARKRVVGHNTNVMGYPFPEGTRAMSSLPLLAPSFLFFSYIPQSLVLTMSSY